MERILSIGKAKGRSLDVADSQRKNSIRLGEEARQEVGGLFTFARTTGDY